MKQMENREQKKASIKLLYAASTASHLRRFHMPYIEELKKDCDVQLMAAGEGVDHSIPFEKSMTSPKNLRAIREIRAILRREQFDAVILNTSLAAFLIRAAMIGLRHRPRVLNIVHGYLFSDPPKGSKDRILLLCERLMRKRTDAIAVMNEADLAILKKRSLCRGACSFMRGMGMPEPNLPAVRDEALRRQYAPQDGDVLLTFVGELSRRKNQSFLISAMTELRRRGLPVRLLLVGEGDARAELEQQIADADLQSSVYLCGSREPVLPYLAISDLYASASRIEGLPFNMMEAMSCGLPILASDIKGQTDLLEDTPDCLYPAGDLQAFCNGVEALISSNAVLGCGTRQYPRLAQYRLSAVFEENLRLMKGFIYAQ